MNEAAFGCTPAAGQHDYSFPQDTEVDARSVDDRAARIKLHEIAAADEHSLLGLEGFPQRAPGPAGQPGSEIVAERPRLRPPEKEKKTPTPLADLAQPSGNGRAHESLEGNGNARDTDIPSPAWLVVLSPEERVRRWFKAVSRESYRTVTDMLSSPLADVNAVDESGNTALHLAIHMGSFDLLHVLLGSARIDINAADAKGRTALLLAVMDDGLKIDASGEDGRSENADRHETMLRMAALFVKRAGMAVNAADKDGCTALSWAAGHGREEMVRVLLKAPAIAVNATDVQGWSALRCAAEGRHAAIVRLLLSHPCIRVAPAQKGQWSVLQYAFDNNLCDLVLQLVQRPGLGPELGAYESRHVFLVAAEQGKTDMVRALLTLPDLDVNMVASERVDYYGDYSALVLAAIDGHLGTVEALLEAPGIDLNFKFYCARSALFQAMYNDHDPVALRLLAEPDIMIASNDRDDKSVVHLAAEKHKVAILRAALATPKGLKMLVRRGGPEESTPLQLAIESDDNLTQAIELLLTTPGIENDENGCGKALLWAVENDHHAAVERLLSFNIDYSGDDGLYAVAVAAKKGNMALVRAILTRLDRDLSGWEHLEDVTDLAFSEDNAELVSTLAACREFELAEVHLTHLIAQQSFASLQALVSGSAIPQASRHELAWEALCEGADQGCLDGAFSAILDAGCDPTAILDAADAEAAANRRHEPAPAARASLHDWLLQRASAPGIPCPRLQQTLRPAAPEELRAACAALIAGEHDIASLHLPDGPFSSRLMTATCLANAAALGFALGHYRSQADDNALDGEVGRQLKHKALWNLFLVASQEFQALQDDIDRYCADGQTLLTRAAQAGDLALLDVLVGLGASLHMPAQDGDQPLMAAVKARQWEAAIKLLTLGARHAIADRQARPLAFHVCQGFAQVGDSREADRAATLIEMLLDLDVAFDQFNPDMESARRFPSLADLLTGNPQSLACLAGFQGTSQRSGANPARTEKLVRAILNNTQRRGTQRPDRQLNANA